MTKKRGPKSSAELRIETLATGIVVRPEAPYSLTQPQVVIWDRITNAMPADWFTPETYDLLAVYCRHVSEADRIASLIQTLDPQSEEFTLKDYDTLLKMQEREGRAASSLATRMRITQQAKYNEKTAHTAANGRSGSGKKPWQ